MTPITRRRFLRMAGNSVALGLFPAHSFAQPAGDADVLVIGAGVAGLAATHVLRNAGLSTLVLEARNRIGGRIWTTRRGLDVGASWIHGQRGNPLMKWALRTKSPVFDFNYEKHWRYDATGELSESAGRRIDNDFGALSRQIAEAQKSAPVSRALAPTIDSHLQKLPKGRQTGLRYAINTTLVHEYANDPSALSLRYFDDGNDQRGGDLLLPAGYGGLLQGLIPREGIRFGNVVHKISWKEEGVQVFTSEREFSARGAIVTLPLGVLRSSAVQFSPVLPAPHNEAIQKLGVGTLNKLFLKFPRVAWPGEPHLFGFVGSEGWWEEWVNFAAVNGQPVLLGFNAGNLAEKSEAMSDRELVATAMRILRVMFGSGLPEPVEATATRWKSNPFSLGSYSCYAPGSQPQDREILASPVSPSLIFAGEACSTAHPATVHGALSSGESAARLLIKNLRGS